MNIIRKLTLANLKENKNRTIVTILGVLLSTALILAVIGMAQSGQASLAAWEKNSSGDFHTLFTNLPIDATPYATENAHVKSSAVFYTYGYALLEGNANEYKPYTYVVGGDSTAFQKLSLHLIEGHFPENENELLISESMIASTGLDLKVGDSLTLAIGRRVDDSGYELFQHNYYDLEHPDTIVDPATRTFTIVGICQRCSNMVEPYEAPGFTAFTYADSSVGALYANVCATYTKASSFAGYSYEIQKAVDAAYPENYMEIDANKYVLEYEGAVSSGTLKALYTLAAIILIIIVLTSVFVIRNSFAISVSEKTRQYGMLASVGATSRQIRSSVLFEGLIIGLIGIPLGLLLGYTAIRILILILNYLLKDFLDGMRFYPVLSPLVVLVAVVLGALTIYLSCLIPAIRAGHIAPIEAIRSNQDVRIRSGRLRVSRLYRKLFGIGGVIAAKNLKRSRRKYRTTVVSLVVSISVFIALSYFTTMGMRITTNEFKDYKYNLRIYGLETSEDNEELCAQLEETDYTYYKQPFATLLSNDCMPGFGPYSEDNQCYATFVVLDDSHFKAYLKENGVNADPVKAVIVNDYQEYFSDGKIIVEPLSTLKAGDTVPVQVQDTLDIEVKVTARAEKKPIGFENTYSNTIIFVVGPDYFPAEILEDSYLSPLYIQSQNPNQTESRILEISHSDTRFANLSTTNLHRDAQQQRNLILVIEIFLYGFITVITLIGVTNIFNTISTNMLLRRREFAMLQSIGMTKSAFRRMLYTENILYSSRALLIGIPLGILGSYALYKATAMRIDMGYQIPWTAILISILFVFLIVGLTMLYSLRKMSGQNIVETIRSENT